MKSKKEMECSNCGSMAKVTSGSYQFKECGLKNVVLVGIDRIVCTACGNVDPIIPQINELMGVLAVAIISQPYRLRGEDVRFLRKFIGKNGKEFCELLHVDRATLSKWENNEDPIGASNDRLVRAITLALGDGLEKRLEAVVKHVFPNIAEGTSPQEIEIDTDNMSYQYA
jgi:YgiT-type zinc finger domain-containing protein